MARIVASLILLTFACLVSSASTAQEKEEKKSEKTKSGTAIGILVSKDKNSIDVKADGEEKPRKYVPHWRGGEPAKGGGLDKDMLKKFGELKVGSRIEVKWEFEERLRD